MSEQPYTEQDQAQFLGELRSGTQYWHQQLEDLELSRSLLQEDLQQADYLLYLKAMYGFVQPFEAQAYPALKVLIPDMEERRRAQLLQRDMQYLGMSEAEIAALPLATIAAEQPLAAWLGAAYVLEGSTLGGMVIAKHVGQTLDLDGERGASFFQPYGKQVAGKWKAFLSVLVGHTLVNDKSSEVIGSATETFRAIHDWFSAYQN